MTDWVATMSARAARGEAMLPPEQLLHEFYDEVNEDEELRFVRGFLCAMALSMGIGAVLGALAWCLWQARPW